MATPAKLDPVTCNEGDAAAKVAGPRAAKLPNRTAKMTDATRLRRPTCLTDICRFTEMRDLTGMCRLMGMRRSSESTIDIILSSSVGGLLEHCLGRPVLDDLSGLVLLGEKECA